MMHEISSEWSWKFIELLGKVMKKNKFATDGNGAHVRTKPSYGFDRPIPTMYWSNNVYVISQYTYIYIGQQGAIVRKSC